MLYNRTIEKATGTLPPDPAAVSPQNNNEPGGHAHYSMILQQMQGGFCNVYHH